MTNKKYLFNEAENLYVNQLKTVETIARELNLCRKTVMLWKESGDWDRKKLELHKARMTIHEKMYKFAQKLLNDIIADIDAGNKVDAKDSVQRVEKLYLMNSPFTNHLWSYGKRHDHVLHGVIRSAYSQRTTGRIAYIINSSIKS